MTLEEAKSKFEPILDEATVLPPNEVSTFTGLLAAALERWKGTQANPQGLSLVDFDILFVLVPAQFNMPLPQRQAVITLKKSGRFYLSDLSLAVLGGGYVVAVEMSNLSKA